MKEAIQKIIVLVFVLISFAGVSEASSDITVLVNEEELTIASDLAKVIDQSVYVPIRSIAEHLGAKVDWYAEDNTVHVQNGDQSVQLILNQEQAVVNGELIHLDKAPFAEAGRTYVPIRFLSESLRLNVHWIQETRSVMIASELAILSSPTPATVIDCSEEDKEWLAKIIEAEAGGEPLEGKIAVGAVIINRAQSEKFMNTITDVIFEVSSGYYQFSPVQNKKIYQIKPSKETYEAVERALAGEDPSEGALYFYNPKTSISKWITSRKVTKDIGSHRFAL